MNTMTDAYIDQADQSEIILKPNKQYEMAVRIKNGEAGEFIYCMEDDKFYHYDKGYWQPLYEIDFLGKIQEAISDLTNYAIQSRKSVAENFKILSRRSLTLFNGIELINLENGMLSPWDGSIEEHDPIYYSTIRIPYIYDPVAKCGLWEKSLDEIFESNKEKIGMLQEFFGYCLTRDVKQHKALLLLGESRSGKSTILNLLRYLVGVNNCSAVPLKYIVNPQNTFMLINKLVNLDPDVSAKAAEFEAEFKTITAGDPVHANPKHIHPFDFIPHCKMVMAANIFPKITDHSSAFYNRLILLPCDRVFTPEEQNRDLPKQLLGELPGILNWCMAGLRRLTDRGRFEELQFMQDAVHELEDENNPVNMFFDEHVIVLVDNYTYIEKGDLFGKYKIWCEQTKNYTLSKARFAACVFKQYHKVTPKSTNLENGKRIWKNIMYVEFKSMPEVINEEIKVQDEITWGQEGDAESADETVADGVNEGQG